MEPAVRSHLEHRTSWYSPFVGPFVCPDRRLGELAAAVGAAPAACEGASAVGAFEVSAVLAGGARELAAAVGPAGSVGALASLGRSPALTVVSLEVPLGDPERALEAAGELVSALESLPADAVVYAEVPWRQRAVVAKVLDVLAGAGLRAKLRTGGLEEAAFPAEQDVAHFISEAVWRGMTFKCTAGLHEAVRVRGRTGFEQMGFANILVATAVALEGGSERDVEAALLERDEDAVTEQLLGVGAPVRRAFAGFGTCSVIEPVEELVRLGLIEVPVT